MTVALLAVAGGLGALARAEVGWSFARRGRPGLGTHLVNVTGALLLGALVGLHADAVVSGEVVTVLGTGFLGGFTTFSTWMVQATADGARRVALATLPVLAAGLVAAAAGLAMSGGA